MILLLRISLGHLSGGEFPQPYFEFRYVVFSPNIQGLEQCITGFLTPKAMFCHCIKTILISSSPPSKPFRNVRCL